MKVITKEYFLMTYLKKKYENIYNDNIFFQ